ncbi:MAG: energy transducer TonB [Cyclobacteriaceae bacterium]|nr:energy transducer TonB [Cyclobacteriaceae bacterium]
MLRSIVIVLMVIGTSVRAQEKRYYLDSCENFVSADHYAFLRITRPVAGKLMDVDFEDYDKNGNLLVKGQAGSRNGLTKKGSFEYYRPGGRLLAKGFFEKGVRTGAWQYFDAHGRPTTADELIKEMPTVTFVKDSALEKGRCLCYARHGYWEKIDLSTRDAMISYYQTGDLITIDGGFIEVDMRPEYQGGMEAFYKYVHRKIDYPRISRKKGMQGDAFFSFVVSAQGEVTKIKPIRSVDYATNKIIEKALRSTSGHWRPGIREGKNVPTYLILPVQFRLTER